MLQYRLDALSRMRAIFGGQANLAYRFGDYELDPRRRELRSGPDVLQLEPQVFDTLLFLVENRGRVVSRDELVAAIWSGRNVSNSTVESRISVARKAIGDDGKSQKAIRTVSRRGFRFVGDVKIIDVRGGAMPPASEKVCIAVLPFTNVDGEPERHHFVSGIVSELTADLSGFPSLRVVSTSMAALYHREVTDLREIARELDVQYAVEGSFQETDVDLRMSVRLTEASQGMQLWAHRFDVRKADLTAVRDEIRMVIVGSLIGEGGPLNRAEHVRALQKPSDSLTARDLYYRAEAEFWKFNKAANQRAQTLLESSLTLDPSSVAAHALLAWVHWCKVQMFAPECREASLDAAHREARLSVELDPADYRGHWAMGAVLRIRGEPDAAMAEYERALTLNGHDPDLLAEWAEFLSYSGRAKDAVSEVQRAISSNRFHPDWYLRILVRAHYNARQYEEAIRLGRRFQNPRMSVLENIAASYAQLGLTQEARKAIGRMLGIKPDHSIELFVADNPEMDEKVLDHFVEGLRKAGLPNR